MNRWTGSLGLVWAILAPIATADTPADDPKAQAEAVLAAAGLHRMPRTNSYVVAAESEARQAFEIAEVTTVARQRRADDLRNLEADYGREKASAEAHLKRARDLRDEARRDEDKKDGDGAKDSKLEDEARDE